jgi:preprotein translocase subunit Sec63
VLAVLLVLGWGVFAAVIYQISQFDYEMANFDPYEILEVGWFEADPLRGRVDGVFLGR